MNTENKEALRGAFEAWVVNTQKTFGNDLEYCERRVKRNSIGGYSVSFVQGQWEGFQAAHNAQQAIIDRLMLEYCPDEMSEQQMKAWEDSQRRVKPTFAHYKSLSQATKEASDAIKHFKENL